MADKSRNLYLRIFGEDKTASKTLDRVSRKASSTGKKLAGSLGVKIGILGVGAAIAKIGSLGIAYQDSLNTFQAVSKASGEEMAKVAERARALGNDLTLPATSAAGAATAMTELAKAGLTVKESMEAAKGTLQLAAAAQVDEATAASLTAAALNSFHLEGSQAVRVADLLAGASIAAMGEITDMGQALNQASAIAASAGVSIDDTTAAISLMAKNGILGSDAGTSIKTMLMKLQGPSDKAAGALKDLGINIYDAHGKMLPFRDLVQVFTAKMKGLTQQQRDQANSTIFGTDAARAAIYVLEAGVPVYDKMVTEITRQGIAADVAAAKTKGLGGAFGGLQSTAETLAIDFYNKVAPGMTAVVRALSDVLAAVGPVIVVLGKMISLGGHLVGFLVDHKVAVGALATIYIASLAPAILITYNRIVSMITLKVIDFLTSMATGAERAAVQMRALSTAQAGATLIIAGGAFAFYELVQSIHRAEKAGRDFVKNLAKDLKPGDFDGLRKLRDDTDAFAKAQGKAANSRNIKTFGQYIDYASGGFFRHRAAAKGARQELAKVEDQVTRTNQNIHKFGMSTDTDRASVLRLAKAAGVDLSGSFQEVSAKLTKYRDATAKGTPASHTLAQAMKAMGDSSASAEDKVDALKDSLDALFGIVLNVDQASDAYQAAIDDLAKSVKENGRTLDGHTAKGRENKDAIRSVIEATLDLVKAQADVGATSKTQQDTMARGRAELIRVATQAGLTKDQMHDYLEQLKLTPKNINTVLGLNVAPALSAIQQYQAGLAALDAKNKALGLSGSEIAAAHNNYTSRPVRATPKPLTSTPLFANPDRKGAPQVARSERIELHVDSRKVTSVQRARVLRGATPTFAQ